MRVEVLRHAADARLHLVVVVLRVFEALVASTHWAARGGGAVGVGDGAVGGRGMTPTDSDSGLYPVTEP